MADVLPETLQKLLSVYHPMTDKTCNELTRVTRMVEFAENEIFEEEGHRVEAEYMVVDGIVRAFVITSEGNDITVNFFTRGRAVTPIVIRNKNNQAFYNLQVISKSARLLVFDRAGMQGEMQRHEDIRLFGNAVMMSDALQKAEHEITLLKATGIEKLDWFRKHYKNLENRVQHYHIASFLGMTPTSLSRIRASNS